MPEKEYNLLHEPWIMVMRQDGVTEEVSLLEVFRRAPEWRGLAGELPTQDIALLRLLLAILHAVFARYDNDGKFSQLLSPDDALERWIALWEKGEFPIGNIEKYLLHYEDHFYLFHPECPFYQVPRLDKATENTAAKLNGELSESNNKIRLFPQRTGERKNTLSFAEAARWLIYLNAFDDASLKPSEKGLPSPGVGWLGKLGMIIALGDNLFETLLLNLVFLRDGGNELWSEEKPVWETKMVKSEERTQITIPDNPSGLLTLQSRRIKLKRQQDSVIGYYLLGGDFFPEENTFYEQMTLWRNATKNKNDTPEHHPRRHDPARQLWRDFSVLMGQGGSARLPGVIGWLSRLKEENIFPSSHFRFQTAAVKYDKKNCSVDDVFADTILFNAALLTNLGENWVNRIIVEIETADQLAEQVGQLAKNLATATGNTDGSGRKKAAKEQAYFRLDEPFRRWLEAIDPNRDDDRKDEVCDQWWQQARRIVKKLGEELINQSGPQAFIGRIVKNEKNKRERRYTAPEAYNRFLYRTSTRKALIERRVENG